MGDFLGSYQYVIAWLIYVLAGVGCCAVWWKLTSFIQHRGWRDLSRGIVVVLIFTPWYTGESAVFYAPAAVVLLMDVLLEGAKADMKGGLALLVSSFIMLIVLTGRLVFLKKIRLDVDRPPIRNRSDIQRDDF
jgi:small basic protein